MERRRTFPQAETAVRLLLVVGAIAVVVALVETPALLNLVDYRTVFNEGFIGDTELVRIGKPYWHERGSMTGGGAVRLAYRIPPANATTYHWDFRRDRNGFRNPPDLTAADLAVIGDSFVEGQTIPGDELMTSRLAKLQNQTVANLGQSAYGPQQELIVLKRYGLPLRPRQVIWMFYEGNDLSDARSYDQFIRARPSFRSRVAARSFTRNALNFFRLRLRTLPPAASASAIVPTWRGKVTYYFIDADAFSARSLTSDGLAGLHLTAEALASADRLSAAQGARMLFVYIPDKFRVLRDYASFPPESVCRYWGANDLPERVRRMVAAASPAAGYLDLTRALSAAAANGNPPYYSDDGHWNSEGHRIAAEEIHRYLSSWPPDTPQKSPGPPL
jgi:hypothetical protein